MDSPTLPRTHYLNEQYGIASWLLTRDHKRIALLFLSGVTFFFFIGGAFAVLIRLELATPIGDMVSDETYNKLFTMHGVAMVIASEPGEDPSTTSRIRPARATALRSRVPGRSA